MNESSKTLLFVGLAVVIVGAAAADRYVVRRNSDVATVSDTINKPLFADFTDPLAAKSLEIITFDENQAALRTFKVANVNGRWVVPSHGNYPADAENRLRDAAAGLITVKALDVASQLPTDHGTYGVIEPSADKLQVGDEGVGTLVVMQDGKGDDLLRLIIGKEVAGAPEQRFVRKPSEDVVYVANIDLSKLPTDFDQWIEKDLLKLNALDVAQVTLKDYSILPTPTGRPYYYPRMEATVSWNSEEGAWDLQQMLVRAGQKMVEAGLTEQEELNKQKLDELKTALDDLKIADVVRKPEGLGASLTAGSDVLQFEQQLAEYGFLIVPKGDEKFDIAASNGEVLVGMKDGVEYVLRFGKVQGSDKSSEEGKLNRFLFVTAQLSSKTLTPPTLEPVPGEEGEGEAKDDQKADGDKQDGKQDDGKQDDGKGDEKSDEKKDNARNPAADRIKRENQRKMDEFNEKRKKAEARVAELNARFNDWYYVISEDVYKKIHLSRTDIVKEGASAAETGYGIDAFRKLESDGIVPKPSASPMGSPFPGIGVQ